jgi:hypothetical protein
MSATEELLAQLPERVVDNALFHLRRFLNAPMQDNTILDHARAALGAYLKDAGTLEDVLFHLLDAEIERRGKGRRILALLPADLKTVDALTAAAELLKAKGENP